MTDQLTSIEPQLDADRAIMLAGLLGAKRLAELLDLLRRRLAGLTEMVPNLPAGYAEILAIVHQNQGSARSLGLNGLALALEDMEAMLRATSADVAKTIKIDKRRHSMILEATRRASELFERERLLHEAATKGVAAR